ncbi:rho family-interacting cell polarization regulator 1 [Stegastes partitus]|uniref:Rho family-interacting cell polarization regulator 1 n=1 Tax=Stegastes partitus TaxID=144197 RepID=A0A9Y4NB33_9TELE|nr:PREDICTED: protein FAM65A [Stegastes partitus]
MYSGYGGSPSRTLSTMSLSVRPVRRLTSRSITRSQSFAGVNTYDKPYRSLSVFPTPGLNRKPSRASRMFTMSTKSNPPPKTPQPERLNEVYEALKKGLQSYLQVHQMDLDSLSRQMKESKRNSRLGFLYELDKQVKVTERYIRRLEFHLSKVRPAQSPDISLGHGQNRKEKKNLYLFLCLSGLAGFARLCAGDQYEIFMKYGRQRWKLRGRMELNAKQVWDSEDMVFLPLINDFLSVKVTEVKSLANHVVVGSVSCETKDLFAALPQTVAVDINDLGTLKLSLEVTWNPFDKDDQGSVSSTVNKAPSVSKRFSTIFNQSPPDTPSLREQAFYNMLRHREELENGTAWSNSSESSDDSSSPQLSVQGLRNSKQQKAMLVTPEIPPGVTRIISPQPDISCCPRYSSSSPNSNHKATTATEVPSTTKPQEESNRDQENGTVTVISEPDSEKEAARKQSPIATADVVTSSHASHPYSRSLSHISESSADGIVVTDKSAGESGDVTSTASGISINDIEMEMPSRTPEPPCSGATDPDVSPRGSCVLKEDTTHPTQHLIRRKPGTSTSLVTSSSPSSEGEDPDALSQMNTLPLLDSGEGTYIARRVPVEEDMVGTGADCVSRKDDGLVDSGLEDALGTVVSSLDDYRGQFPELQLLEQELKLLQVTLKGGRHSRSPSVASLTVETALGSFDFLNTSEWEEEEDEEEKGDKRSRNIRSLQDRGWDSPALPTSPLTTGCTALDCCLVVHLKNCSAQLLRLGMFGPLRCGEMYALDRLLREARVLEIIRRITKDNPQCLKQPAEVIPQLGQCVGAVSLWQQCAGQGSVYSASAESFLAALSAVYSSKLPERADTVFLSLVERVLDQRLPRRGSSRDGVTVTLFQLWGYLESNGVSDMETHITELAEEVWLVQSLASFDQDVIVQALRRPAECSLKREGLHAVAKLLKDPRGKVSASASSVLRSLVAQPKQREQALVSCLELLEDENVDTRVCGCKALACLKAKESIDQLVYLCRTDKEEVREAAKQTLLVLGEEGKMAHRHVETSQDSLPRLFAPGSMASTAF